MSYTPNVVFQIIQIVDVQSVHNRSSFLVGGEGEVLYVPGPVPEGVVPDENGVDEPVADDAQGHLDVLHGEPEPGVDRLVGEVHGVLHRRHPLF